MLRNEVGKSIVENIKNVNDDIVSSVYDKMRKIYCENFGNEYTEQNNRGQKIIFIEKNMYMVSDIDLQKINDLLEDNIKYNKMYATLLEILNEILALMKIDKIHTITDFKNIPRNKLKSDECNKIIMDKRVTIINSGFGKNIDGFYTYKRIKYGHLNVLRTMIEKLGYTLTTFKASKMSNGTRKFSTSYSIKKNA